MKGDLCVIGVRGFPRVQGGVEKHAEELYPRLARLGWTVTVFTRKPYMPGWREQPEWNGVRFIHLWCPRFQSLETLTHSFLAMLFCLLRRPELVHIHNMGPALTAPLLKLARLKVVVTYHSINYQHRKWGPVARGFLRLGEAMCVRFADRVIVVADATYRYLQEKYPDAPLVCVPNGVSLPRPLPPGETLQRYGLTPGRYAFTAARLAEEKGIHDLIEAYRMVAEPGFKMVVAGEADYGSSYRARIHRMAAGVPGIILAGYLSGDPLTELYSNAGLFVLPSLSEGMPMALLEALGLGLPVLVTDMPQTRDLPIRPERYCQTGSPGQLARKLVDPAIWSSPAEERQKLAEWVRARFDWIEVARRTDEICRETLVQVRK